MAENEETATSGKCSMHDVLTTNIEGHNQQLKALWDQARENQQATLSELTGLRASIASIQTEIVRSAGEARTAILEERLVAQKAADENRHRSEIAVLEERGKAAAALAEERSGRRVLAVKMAGLSAAVAAVVSTLAAHIVK
jgi:hypothetical protein